ncbi:MAG: hypothetical protein WC058_00790 [Phycisphaeraceae bacterium]
MPDPLGEFVQTEIARGHFEGASEYFRSLVREKVLQQSGPALETELLHRLDQYETEGGVPVNDTLWDQLKQRRKRLSRDTSHANR